MISCTWEALWLAGASVATVSSSNKKKTVSVKPGTGQFGHMSYLLKGHMRLALQLRAGEVTRMSSLA